MPVHLWVRLLISLLNIPMPSRPLLSLMRQRFLFYLSYPSPSSFRLPYLFIINKKPLRSVTQSSGVYMTILTRLDALPLCWHLRMGVGVSPLFQYHDSRSINHTHHQNGV